MPPSQDKTATHLPVPQINIPGTDAAEMGHATPLRRRPLWRRQTLPEISDARLLQANDTGFPCRPCTNRDFRPWLRGQLPLALPQHCHLANIEIPPLTTGPRRAARPALPFPAVHSALARNPLRPLLGDSSSSSHPRLRIQPCYWRTHGKWHLRKPPRPHLQAPAGRVPNGKLQVQNLKAHPSPLFGRGPRIGQGHVLFLSAAAAKSPRLKPAQSLAPRSRPPSLTQRLLTPRVLQGAKETGIDTSPTLSVALILHE